MKKAINLSMAGILGVVIFTSCTNASADNPGIRAVVRNQITNAAKRPDGNIITFKAGIAPVTTSGWNISRSIMMDVMVLNITSNMHREPKTVNININGDKQGNYKFSQGVFNKKGYAYGSYFANDKEQMMNPYNFEDGEITITSIDTVKGILNATFYGRAKNNKGETVTISDGKVIGGNLKAGFKRY